MENLLNIDAIATILSERGMGILGALAILVIGRIAAGMIKSGARKSMNAAKVDATLIPFLAGLVYFSTMAVVFVMALNAAGFNTTSLVAIFGAAGLAIALAFQGTISNFASGVMLLVFRPISVGNWVEVAGQAGSVVKIDVFTTALNTGDNVRIVVPNGKIFGEVIKNYNANDTRRIDLMVGVGYDDDLNRAIEVILNTLKSNERVLQQPAPVVAVHEMADSSMNFVVRPWVKTEDYWMTRWDLTKALKENIEANGMSIPYPQRDVHLFQQAG